MISGKMASLVETQTVLGFGDAYLLLEILRIDSYNRSQFED